MEVSIESLMTSAQLPPGDAKIKSWHDENLEAVRKLKPFKINALAANELTREKPGNGFHARRQKG